MARDEIVSKLKDILVMVMGKDSAELEGYSEQSGLISDMGLNSVGILYVVIAIEEYFGIQFDDVGFGDFETVGDVIDYIEKKAS